MAADDAHGPAAGAAGLPEHSLAEHSLAEHSLARRPWARHPWAGGALALFAAAAFALHNVNARLAFDGGSDPLTVIALRALFAAGAIWLYCRLRGQKLRLERRLRFACLALGLVLALQSYGLLESFRRIPVSLAVLVFYTYPILVALVYVVLERTALTLFTGLALGLAFAGLVLALDISSADFNWSGAGFAALAAICMTCTLVGGARVVRAAGPMAASFHMILASGGVFALLLAIRGAPALPDDPAGWFAFAAAPVTYLIAIMSFFIVVGIVSGTRLALILNSEPIITIGLAAALLGETLSPLQAAGATLVVVAVFIARRPAAGSKAAAAPAASE